MRSDYNTNSPQADHMSFEQYLESEIETSRLKRARGDVLGRGRNSGPGDSGRRSREAGHASHYRGFVSRPGHQEEAARFDHDRKPVSSPRPRESEHHNREVGRFSHDRNFFSLPGPRESKHRNQEVGHSNHDRFPVSRPRPHGEYMHHATTPSPVSRARRGTDCPDCEDTLDDDIYDEAYSDNDSLAVNTGTSTRRISPDRTLLGHRPGYSRRASSLGHTRGTDSPYLSDSTDSPDDNNTYDDDLPREALRPTTRLGPISHPRRRAQSPPPPLSVQSPPPLRPDYVFPHRDRLPPPPPSAFALGSPAQSLPSTRDSQARSGAGCDVSLCGIRRGPRMANGAQFGETGYDARGGLSPGNGRGWVLRDC